MTALSIAAAIVAILLLASAGWLILNRRPRGDRPELVEILELEDSTSIDPATGAVRSVQEADIRIAQSALAEIWTPAHLERLARTYWRFLTRVTLGLIRVHYTEGERSVVLLGSPLRLLTFQAPEYELTATRGLVRWRIERGLLVARRGRDGGGYLQIEVRRSPARDSPGREDTAAVALHVEVEVANFYPAIASRLGLGLYNATQSRLHVIITHSFLRSLARLDLAESRVGRFDP